MKYFKKTLGITLLLLLTGGMLFGLAQKDGWYVTILSFLAALAITGLVGLAVWLIVE